MCLVCHDFFLKKKILSNNNECHELLCFLHINSQDVAVGKDAQIPDPSFFQIVMKYTTDMDLGEERAKKPVKKFFYLKKVCTFLGVSAFIKVFF
jgi:hypothetical protein